MFNDVRLGNVENIPSPASASRQTIELYFQLVLLLQFNSCGLSFNLLLFCSIKINTLTSYIVEAITLN
jgi:hypothetical protein